MRGGETPLSFQQARNSLQAEAAHAEDLLWVGIEGKREGRYFLAFAARWRMSVLPAVVYGLSLNLKGR